MGTLIEFKDFVLATTLEHYAKTGRPLLLSTLGYIATQNGYVIENELKGIKLTPFIKDNLSNELDVVQPGTSALVFAVVPKGEAPNVIEPAIKAGSVRYPLRDVTRSLQAAFLRPIPHGFTRYILPSPKVSYVDVKLGESGPSGAIWLDPQYLPEGARHGEGDHLLECILRWARAHGVENIYTRDTPPIPGQSLLAQLIAGLTHEELQRVTLPLDVVAKLMGK